MALVRSLVLRDCFHAFSQTLSCLKCWKGNRMLIRQASSVQDTAKQHLIVAISLYLPL